MPASTSARSWETRLRSASSVAATGLSTAGSRLAAFAAATRNSAMAASVRGRCASIAALLAFIALTA